MRTVRSARTRVATAVLAALSAALLAAALAAAPLVYGGEPESVTGRDALVIGVDHDLPGLSARTGGGPLEGFEIDVAAYVAGRLGVAPADVTLRPLRSARPEDALRDGTIDMAVSTRPITAARKDRVTFAGPYYLAHQDILVRQGDRAVRTVRDLRGKRICKVSGSDSWWVVTGDREVAAVPVPMASYAACAESVAAGRVDAATTDDLVLAGLAAAVPGTTVVNAPFTDVKYGIALPEGDREGCLEVNRILTGMYQNGAAATMLDRWFGTSGLDLPASVPQFEGCP
ncbi:MULTISPECIES: transporter substrate-binding domain-containing protein [Actinomadura]|uniref:transporter substrate-binding domain-containing protein n=1 Tax=Actinomadura TaxID=1988 RepID=UPI00040DE799|nr:MULTISPECIES: transporter substrate-binding domain-containing protein [Actinomadura]RSN52152.1 ABC transporter substrate-binding protein [Actinomadura sp. WAC 06369]